MRIGFVTEGKTSKDALERAVKPALERFGIKASLADTSRKPIIIMVSKFDHAMRHLLYQIQVGWLQAKTGAFRKETKTDAPFVASKCPQGSASIRAGLSYPQFRGREIVPEHELLIV